MELSRKNGLRTDLTALEVDDLNTVSTFLATPQSPLPAAGPSSQDDEIPTQTHTFVLAGHAILPLTTAFFNHLDSLQGSITLVIAGGIGHSTQLLYTAIAQHPIYRTIPTEGKSEAAILRDILVDNYPALAGRISFRLLIDEKSTNCGANAVEAKKLLDENGIRPERIYIVQDPTMHRRTIACFDKIYEDEDGPDLLGWSFIPRIYRSSTGSLEWDDHDSSIGPITQNTVWSMERFISLVIGEVPRLRDDEHGYGPKGKGFITHVDIPVEVEEAWDRLSRGLTQTP